mmetsp:Transcript_11644/g.19878  ORF Transcript_11644/g.19878 Transcript_11644/m.19878 type:complete len:410 (-) Transcript_11644:28-1257(-)
MEEIGLASNTIKEDVDMKENVGGDVLGEEDYYKRLKSLQRQLKFLSIQEEYIKDEQKNLKREILRAQEEVKRIQSVPLVLGQFLEMIDENHAIIGSTTGSSFYVRVLSTLNREQLKPSSSVALHKHSNSIVDILPPESDASIQLLTAGEKPDVSYSQIGGLDIQKQEIREAVELPLTHFDLYKQIGIDPPRGVLLYGPPGMGKTMLAKAVAANTAASFIRVVGSEFVQKYLGEGPRMVRDVFRLARENAPAIIFIDELDAIGTKRFNSEKAGDREVQRTMLELLNQLDGFSSNDDVKVIAATNRIDILDPALLRSGRIDRKIEFPLPNEEARARILVIHSRKMKISPDVNFDELARCTQDFNGAQMKAVCVEAGMLALRRNAKELQHEDFVEGIGAVQAKKKKSLAYYA